MSLKPKKKSEQKKIDAKLKTKNTQIENKYKLPPYIMIVSEGTKTEPLYLKGFVRKINEQYKSISKNNHIDLYGTGRNTKGLLKFIEKKLTDGSWSHYKQFWLVYDKDDFPYDDFDNTQFMAEARKKPKISVAWSNESIELWFLLHFQDYYANNGRKQYIEKLNEYFDYSKTREDLYDVIMEKGSLSDAKKRARKMYQEFSDGKITSPSAMVPATRMHELIEDLEQYIDE